MRYLILLLFSFSLMSCNQELPTDKEVSQAPKNLLTKEVFTNLYYDSQLTEAAVRNEIAKGTNTKDISTYLYRELFDKYDITEEDFKDNIRYYASDPELMQEIQTEVVNRLTKKEAELTNQ